MDAFFAGLAPRRVERSGHSSGHRPSQRSREKWTAGGVDYDVDITTYGNPKGIFYATKKTAKLRDPLFQDAQSPRPFTSGGFMDAAFDLLGEMAAAHGEQASRRNSHARQRSAHFAREDEDVFSQHHRRHSRDQHQTRSSNRRSISPEDLLHQGFRRQRTQDDWDKYEQPPRGSANDDQTDRRFEDFRSRTRGASGVGHADDISSRVEALKSTVRFEKEAVETCRRRAAELSSGSRPPRDEEMQTLLDAWRKHEMLLDTAIQDLRAAREKRDRQSGGSRHDKSTRQRDKQSQQSRNRSSKPQRQSSSRNQGATGSPFVDGDGFHDPFASFFAHSHGFGGPFFHKHSEACPHSPPCQAHFGSAPFPGLDEEFIDKMFGARRSGKHKSKTKPSPRANTSERFPSPKPSSTPRQQPPPPPSSWLRPDEAKSLYKTYAEKWTALAPADPKVPFPGRDFNARSLAKRDSIYAPKVFAPISTWSEENVMQANVQAFFLGAVGLSPVYSETGPGKLVMSFDKVKASDQQVRDLIDVLKKEKVRWHSDRLGRRNGGSANGPNTTLQQDERARAVFHAVCELMEVSQA